MLISSPAIADPLPAGGTDPNRFDWQEVWYPVHYVADLNPTQPTPFTLLGRDLVIWWDRIEQTWRVFDDPCPHRLAPLSEGRINEAGRLECPYHGWTFTGTGQCDLIPQQSAGARLPDSPRACARSLPTTVRQGLLFVYPGQPDNAPRVNVPIVPALDETPEEWVCLNTFRDLPYDALTLIENVIDSSHIPYTHHRSVGNRANAGPVNLEVLITDKQGFTGFWAEGPRRGTLGSQNTTFVAPGLMWHDLTSKQFGRTLTVVYATPIRKGECRLFARFPFKFSSKLPELFIRLTPRWYSHIGQNGVLEDDQIFLHLQERYLAAAGGSEKFAQAYFMPTSADRLVIELRRWVNQYSIDPFAGAELPPTASRAQLLDRYHSHTQHCSSCRRALANLQRLRLVVAILGAIAWLGTPLLTLSLDNHPITIVTTVLALGFAIAWWRLGKLERQFYQGRAVPPRNLPEKASAPKRE